MGRTMSLSMTFSSFELVRIVVTLLDGVVHRPLYCDFKTKPSEFFEVTIPAPVGELGNV